jgi:lipoprotein-anchoring transpeptidase ErfK/SrfK
LRTIPGVVARAVLIASVVEFSSYADAAAAQKRSGESAKPSQSAARELTRESNSVARADEAQIATESTQDQTNDQAQLCHWWQFRQCDSTPRADTLPPDAPKRGPVITVDTSTHTAYLFLDGELVAQSPASTGSGKLLKKGLKVWLFRTPEGHLKVLRKIVDPVWTKPDWAFIESGDPVPPPDSPRRQVRGHLGKFALDLGEGIFIHGTDDPRSIGKPASHGCIRLPRDMLKEFYDSANVGTDVYIFESQMPSQRAGNAPEHHSDLDYK